MPYSAAERNGHMYKKKSVLILTTLVLLCLLVGAAGYRNGVQANRVSVQVNEQEITPHILNLSGRSGGNYWDNSVLSLPCVSVKPGENVKLMYEIDVPAEFKVIKYDVLNEDFSLGASESRGEAEKLEFERYKNEVSFPVSRFHTKYQLIICRCKWKFLFMEKSMEYVFALQNE